MPTISIDLTAGQATRLQDALQSRYPSETVNLAFAKTLIVKHLRNIVLDEERDSAIKAVQQSHQGAPFDPS